MTGPRVILIGPMGAGKTSVGRTLASRLRVGFADLDALIVAADGRSIPDIFAADGESGFRALESAMLARALDEHEGILALGGGTPMLPAARELLAGRPVVLLEVDERAAARRLLRGSGRPMLTGEDPMARWRQLLAERGPVYRELAAHHVDASNGSAGHVARTIIETLQLQPSIGPEEETA